MDEKQNQTRRKSTAAKSPKTTAKTPAKPKPARKQAKTTTPAAKRPRGRPTVYTREIADLICRRMASGMSLRQSCQGDDIPPASTVRGWVVDDIDGFAERYARARMLLAEHWADEIVEIADDSSRDEDVGKNGDVVMNAEYVARSRLRVDSRKWIIAKILPKVYGDKLDLNHGVQPENPLAKLCEQVMGTPLKPKA